MTDETEGHLEGVGPASQEQQEQREQHEEKPEEKPAEPQKREATYLLDVQANLDVITDALRPAMQDEKEVRRKAVSKIEDTVNTTIKILEDEREANLEPDSTDVQAQQTESKADEDGELQPVTADVAQNIESDAEQDLPTGPSEAGEQPVAEAEKEGQCVSESPATDEVVVVDELVSNDSDELAGSDAPEAANAEQTVAQPVAADEETIGTSESDAKPRDQ